MKIYELMTTDGHKGFYGKARVVIRGNTVQIIGGGAKMKYKTTKNAVMSGYNNKICVGYCNLQTLLTYTPARAYTERREGWAADIYEAPGNNAIITGYAPFGNIRPSYETCRKYEDAARAIINKYMPYEETKLSLIHI